MKILRMLKKSVTVFVMTVGILFLCLQFAGVSIDIVMSGSMEPAIQTGALVFTNTHAKEPKIGDIITFQLMDTRVTHRVVRMEKGKFVTKGDANELEDGTGVARSQLIGTVIFSLPYLGYAAAFLKTKDAWIMIGVSLVCYFLYHQIRLRKTKERK